MQESPLPLCFRPRAIWVPVKKQPGRLCKGHHHGVLAEPVLSVTAVMVQTIPQLLWLDSLGAVVNAASPALPLSCLCLLHSYNQEL